MTPAVLIERGPAKGVVIVGYQTSEGAVVPATSIPITLLGELCTLLAATTITASGTINHEALEGLEGFSRAGIVLTISGKTMDALTTLNIYVQRSLDGGVSWDDVAAFSQLTSALIPAGTYVQDIILTGVSQIDRAQRDGTLTANTVATVASWGDRLRIKTVAANFAGTDTVTIALAAYMVP